MLRDFHPEGPLGRPFRRAAGRRRKARARPAISAANRFPKSSFRTDRYEAQANERLFDDFKRLRRCLEQIRDTGNYDGPPVIFDDNEHPLPTAEELANPLQWIRKKRLGRAVAAIAMQRTPLDWVTGEKLDASCIRKLEGTGKLDRHHVFPREFLKAHSTTEEANHGLNGVLLTKGSNLILPISGQNRFCLGNVQSAGYHGSKIAGKLFKQFRAVRRLAIHRERRRARPW